MEDRLRQVEVTQAEHHIEIERISDYLEKTVKPIIVDFNKLTGKISIVTWIVGFSLPILVSLMAWSVIIIHNGDKQIGIIVTNQKNITKRLEKMDKIQSKRYDNEQLRK